MQLKTDESGLIMAVPAFSMIVFAPIAGRLSDRYGSRRLCSIASLTCTLSLIVLSNLSSSSSIHLVLLGLAMLGIGIGIFSSPNSRYIMARSPDNMRGMASGFIMAGRRIGTTAGVAIFGVTFSDALHLNGRIGLVNYAAPSVLAPGFQAAFMGGAIICSMAIIMSIMSRD